MKDLCDEWNKNIEVRISKKGFDKDLQNNTETTIPNEMVSDINDHSFLKRKKLFFPKIEKMYIFRKMLQTYQF